MRLPLLSALFLSLPLLSHAQDSTLADAADELRFLAEDRALNIAELRIDGATTEIAFVTDDRGQAIYQGDIVLGDADTLLSLSADNALTLQGVADQGLALHGLVARSETARWPGGQVPYVLDASLPSEWMQRVRDAIAHWEANTSIRFFELDQPAGQYILFYDDPGADSCQSPIGRQKSGPTAVQIASWCKWGNVAHEIGHALGLHHEQARFDRDRFIDVQFSPGATDTTRRQFRQDPVNFADFGPYCYDSIMHYPKTAMGGVFTIAALATPAGDATGKPGRIGQRDRLAACDIATIQQYYGFSATDAVQAQDAALSRFQGDLVFFPSGCEAVRRCNLKNPLTFADPYGLVWKADRRAEGAPDSVMSGTTDGASIPQLAQEFIGLPFDPSYIKAAVIHDHYMYKENRVRGWWSVQRVFYDMLKDQGVPEAKAQVMYLGVLVGASKWIKLVPGTNCGPACLNDLVAASNVVERQGDSLYREWPEAYGSAEYEATMQRGLAELELRGARMTLGDVNLLARDLMGHHPVFTEGDNYSPNSAQDALFAE